MLFTNKNVQMSTPIKSALVIVHYGRRHKILVEKFFNHEMVAEMKFQMERWQISEKKKILLHHIFDRFLVFPKNIWHKNQQKVQNSNLMLIADDKIFIMDATSFLVIKQIRLLKHCFSEWGRWFLKTEDEIFLHYKQR